MYRLAKQITIVTVVLLLVTTVMVLAWKFRAQEPTCFDGVKNQNEEDVDCGGACTSCRSIPQGVRLGEPLVMTGSGNRIDVFFTVENPNPQWGTLRFLYEVAVLDSSGRELASRQGETFIMPLETHIVVEQAISVNAVEGARAVVVARGDPVWVLPPQAVRETSLAVLDPTFTRSPNAFTGAEVRAVIRNDSPYSYDAVEVHVLVRDRATGQVVGARRTEMRTLTARERREFVVSWNVPIPLSGEPELEIVPLTNVFFSENFIREFGNLEEFQRFER